MTVQKLPNQDDVELNSGLQGWESTLHRIQPDEVGVTTSGGGSVSFITEGATASAGTTSGDVARIDGLNALWLDGLATFKTTIVYTLRNATPYTDDVELGWFGNGLESFGAWIDITDGQYKISSSETASATLPSADESAVLSIEVDTVNNQTTFKQSGAVSETVTINGSHPPVNWGLLRMESNGGGETVNIPYVRQTIHGESY